jgi:hypothetical protein
MFFWIQDALKALRPDILGALRTGTGKSVSQLGHGQHAACRELDLLEEEQRKRSREEDNSVSLRQMVEAVDAVREHVMALREDVAALRAVSFRLHDIRKPMQLLTEISKDMPAK